MRLKPYFTLSRLPTLSLLFSMAVTACSRAQLPEVNESQIRAMMILNMTKFIDWPISRSDAHASFVICVVGNDPISMYLENILGDKTVQGRTVLIRRATALDQAEKCHILYWAYPNRKMMDRFSAALINASVLTVSEEHQAHSGTIVGLPLVDGRVAIEINNALARRGNLVLSAHLLQIATEIRK